MKVYFLIATLAAPLSTSNAGKCIDSAWPENELTAHCEQDPCLPYILSIQELQTPTGPGHSDGILDVLSEMAKTADVTDVSSAKKTGTAMGFIYFSNTLYVPGTKNIMGSQSGHCVQVDFSEESARLACYSTLTSSRNQAASRAVSLLRHSLTLLIFPMPTLSSLEELVTFTALWAMDAPPRLMKTILLLAKIPSSIISTTDCWDAISQVTNSFPRSPMAMANIGPGDAVNIKHVDAGCCPM